jgi:hypothetical protein
MSQISRQYSMKLAWIVVLQVFASHMYVKLNMFEAVTEGCPKYPKYLKFKKNRNLIIFLYTV